MEDKTNNNINETKIPTQTPMSSQRPMDMPKPSLNFDDEKNKSSPKEINQTPRSQAKRQMLKPLIDLNEDKKKTPEESVTAALNYAKKAHDCLNTAIDNLNNACNYSVNDLCCGGYYVTVFKHKCINEAECQIKSVNINLKKLNKELKDTTVNIEFVDIEEINDLLLYFDYCCQCLCAEWCIHSKIKRARDDCKNCIKKVETIIQQLEVQLKEIQTSDNLIKQTQNIDQI